MVLAGGRSTRFGRDKLAEPYLGEPLLYRAFKSVAAVCDQVIVTVAHDAGELQLPSVASEVRIVPDLRPDGGPLVGLTSALEVTWTDLALVVGGDMPELSLEVLEGMIRAGQAREDLEAIVLGEGETWRPLPLVVRPAARRNAMVLLRNPSNGLRDLVRAVPHEAVPEDAWRRFDPTGRTLFDIDAPWDMPGGGDADPASA